MARDSNKQQSRTKMRKRNMDVLSQNMNKKVIIKFIVGHFEKTNGQKKNMFFFFFLQNLIFGEKSTSQLSSLVMHIF